MPTALNSVEKFYKKLAFSRSKAYDQTISTKISNAKGAFAMLNQLKKTKRESGFTIIEVMIVLAIAGLIILIVLLAVPALQRNSRNTAIKSDATTVAGAAAEFVSNNEGKLPTATDSTGGGGSAYILKRGTTSAQAEAKLGTNTAVVDADTATGAQSAAADTIKVYFGFKCPSAAAVGTTLTLVGSTRSVAVIYPIENSSSQAAGCIDV